MVTHGPRRERGFTSVELVISITIAAIAIPSLLIGFFQYAEATADAGLRERGVALASSLLEEILGKSFEEPSLAAGSFGKEEGTRVDFDDVDDFDGYASAPPVDSAGAVIPLAQSFSASVVVENVPAANPDPPSPAADGSTPYKRAAVTVAWPGGAVTLKGLSVRIDVAAATSGAGFTYLASSRQPHGNDDFDFRVLNSTGASRTLTSLIALFGPPIGYYEQVRIRVIGGSNHGVVWAHDSDPDARAGPGDRAAFDVGVVVPAGATFEIRLRQFKNDETGGGGGPLNVSGLPFDIILGTATEDFEEFTVPVSG